ncbi:LAMI_0E09296g1_1 [Lachancea mirantina]|uniref:AP-2 complex subunit alpha n=1 Tax=Lachancea mirantina TaxID=1230905 RepID=A0A1G4JNM3_9SACH|nr:LAMI_0E09296g1_1 [Lachancea mirantina]
MVAAMSQNSMKGLQLFIADLRSSQQTEDHKRRIQSEIINIQRQFGSGNALNGYQRKKYVAKLAYIYITTNTAKLNDLLFGLDQCCELMSSQVYSEKYIAYMTLELLYHNESVATQVRDRLVLSLKKDLESNNTDYAALALNFIGVAARNDDNLTHELSDEVFQILRSPTSPQILKKKASLAFLTLLKNDVTILTQDSRKEKLWFQRITSLLDDSENYRLMLAVLPLVEFLATKVEYKACFRLVPHLSQILYSCIVVGTKDPSSFPEEERFAGLPNPWILTKLISILNIIVAAPGHSDSQYDFSSIDQATLGKLRLCVTSMLELGHKPAADALTRSVRNTILFSLINFASKLDPSVAAMTSSINALCFLLDARETNTRYLALDSLVKLCSTSGRNARASVRSEHMKQLFQLMRTERDSSIFKKTVDLLYTLTDSENVQLVVDELLQYVTSGNQIDHHVRSDLVVKIAVLTEKFANDSKWYVTVSLKLLSLSNAFFNDDDIWQRLCQIVINNETLHKVTCDQLVKYICDDHASEAIIKAGAFLLGEFGTCVDERYSIGDLFNIFTEKYFAASNACRAMILSTMVKLYQHDPQIESAVIKFFQLELNSLDIELQTRSYEYLKMIQFEKVSGKSLVRLIFEPMVPFNSKKNPLLGRMGTLSLSSFDLPGGARDDHSSKAPCPPPKRKIAKSVQSDYNTHILSPKWDEGFNRMLKHKQGVFYTSPFLKIIYRIRQSRTQPELIEVELTYVSQSEWPIKSFLTEWISWKTDENPPYVIKNIELPSTTLAVGSRSTHKFEVLVRHPFSLEQSPLLDLQFTCGGSVSSIVLKLGVALSSTIIPPQLNGKETITLAQFVKRWRSINEALGKEGESQRVIKLKSANLSGGVVSTLEKMGIQVITQHSVENMIFGAAITHTKSVGNFGCLMKIRLTEGTAEITCKSTGGSKVSECLSECIQSGLAV